MFYSDGPKEQIRLPTTPATSASWDGNTVTETSMYDASYGGFKAFNHYNGEQGWVTDAGYVDGFPNGTKVINSIYGEYISITFPTKVYISSYTVVTRIYDGSRPSKWYLLGWNDDTGYETIDHQDIEITDANWVSDGLIKTFTVNNINTKFIKLIFVGTHVTGESTHLGFNELILYGSYDYSGTEKIEMGDHLENKMIYQ